MLYDDLMDACGQDELPLTDDEKGGSDGEDSDFGISDRQLEALWQTLDAGGGECSTMTKDAGYNCHPAVGSQSLPQSRPGSKSESGPIHFCMLQGTQMDPLAPAAGAQVSRASIVTVDPLASVDPLRKFAASQRTVGKVIQETPPVASLPARLRGQSAADLVEEQMRPDGTPVRERRKPRVPRASACRVQLVCSRDTKDGTTFYLLRVNDSDGERLFLKRYSDFQELDRALRVSVRNPGALPELPETGVFGVRHYMNIGDFNEKRKQRLQEYANSVISQAQGSLDREPLLARFFGRHAPDRAARLEELFQHERFVA